MKKLLCLILTTLIVIAAVSALALPASAAQTGKLIITDEGRKLGEVEVGNEFIFRVGVNTGDRTLINGQGIIKYDRSYVSFVGYGTDSKGNADWDSYCFAPKLLNTGLVTNYTDASGICYNFSKYSGIEGFTSVKEHYFKARFKAIAPGTTDIRHVMEVMTAREDGVTVTLYSKGKANEQIDPLPYSLSSIETASGCIGDANGDYVVSLPDATYIQMISAGRKLSYETAVADVNGDGSVNLRDALEIRRYLADASVQSKIGEWIFASEK